MVCGVATCVPVLVYRVTVTLGTPLVSPASWMPLALVSSQTLSPIVAGWYNPASSVVLFWPLVRVKLAEQPPAVTPASLSVLGVPWPVGL